VRLQMQRRLPEMALSNLGIDSKLRACDLVSVRVRDVCQGDRVAARRLLCSTRHSARCSSRSCRRPVTPSKHGFGMLG
jgi:hypothetical protein